MYCGKVLPHIYQTPYPALYVATMTTSHCSKSVLQAHVMMVSPLLEERGKLFPAWQRPTVLRRLQSYWLMGPTCGWAELSDKSWCWLLSHEVHQPKAWLTSQQSLQRISGSPCTELLYLFKSHGPSRRYQNMEPGAWMLNIEPDSWPWVWVQHDVLSS